MTRNHEHRQREGEGRLRPSLWDPRHAHLRALARAVTLRLDGLLDGTVKEVVDLGCGGNPFGRLFAGKGLRVTGVDVAPGPGVDVVAPPEGPVPLPGASADLVVSFQVLEHVPRPKRFLDECRRILRPGGALLLTTHGNYPYHPDPLDLHRWTGEGLRRLAADFDVEEVAGVGDGLSTPIVLANIQISRRLDSLRGVRALLAAPFRLATPLLNLAAAAADRTGRPEELPVCLLLLARRRA